ncbi:hypothetical protein STCU_11127 [Strigomonas culicis]|uniref:Uncharacterized protein n=1 Tax=Strigomonas culicis TaxID=28005 RepID=S9TEW8_9TRYP|nr:hypothetical protein STCU_11127 [Strigomonas culicis]|eukprot:EPY16582.1 hypothetical protein STCU_11127 [Strigomonas culicis]
MRTYIHEKQYFKATISRDGVRIYMLVVRAFFFFFFLEGLSIIACFILLPPPSLFFFLNSPSSPLSLSLFSFSFPSSISESIVFPSLL